MVGVGGATAAGPLLNRRRHLHHADVVEAPFRAGAAALIMAAATLVPRDHHVVWRPWSVAMRIRRTVERDGGRADGGREMKRASISRDHQIRLARQLEQVGNLCRRREPSGPARRIDDRLRQRLLAWPPEHERLHASHVAQERGNLAEAGARPSLVRPRGTRIEERKSSRADLTAYLFERGRWNSCERKI